MAAAGNCDFWTTPPIWSSNHTWVFSHTCSLWAFISPGLYLYTCNIAWGEKTSRGRQCIWSLRNQSVGLEPSTSQSTASTLT